MWRILSNILIFISSTAAQLSLLGNSNVDNEGSFCGSKLCLLDASRLLESATTQWSADPCDDFREFSMGSFIKLKALNERYDRVGFLFDVVSAHRDRQRRALSEPIDENEPKALKIAKSFFKKCSDPDYIKENGAQEMAAHVAKSAFPLLEGSNWSLDKFNATMNLFIDALRIDFFFDHRVSRCKDPRNKKKGIICWKFKPSFGFLQKIMISRPNETRKDFWGLLTVMNSTLAVDDNILSSAIDFFLLYIQLKSGFIKENHRPKPVVLPIKKIHSIFSHNSKINWLALIKNSFLTKSQEISEDDEILIEDSEIFSKDVELYEETHARVISDVLFVSFLFGYQNLYVVYAFTEVDSYKRGTKKDYQRNEQCISYLEQFYSPALNAIYARKYFDRNIRDHAHNFLQEAIDNVTEEIQRSDDLEEFIRNEVVRKLETVRIIAGYPDELLDENYINEIYDEIRLNGDENLVETSVRMIKHNLNLENEPEDSWMFLVNTLTRKNHVKYLPEANVLFVPPEYIFNPFYNPDRSRFFNTATLFTEAALALNEGVKKFIKMEYHETYLLNYDSIELGYKNYVKWLDSNQNIEKVLPGFQMSNKQMYWLSFANSYFMKYHINTPFYQYQALNLQYTYFHIWFKARPEFREAFNCSNLNENELKQFELLKERFGKVHRN